MEQPQGKTGRLGCMQQEYGQRGGFIPPAKKFFSWVGVAENKTAEGAWGLASAVASDGTVLGQLDLAESDKVLDGLIDEDAAAGLVDDHASALVH